MVSTRQVFAAAALLSLGSSAPTAKQNEGLSFSVREVANPNYVPEDHLTLYRRALDKASTGLQKRAKSGSAQANAQFKVPVQIGSQKFSLTFDTGSCDLWVVGDKLTGQGKHTYYKPGTSAKQVPGATFKIGYADSSSASGDVFSDTVTLGTVSVTGMDVGHANQATSSFINGDTDGLLGLGPGQPSIKPGPAKSFMDTFAAQGGQKLFAVDLHKDAPGEYDFGMTDKAKHTGEIAYTPSDIKSGYWMITTDDKIKSIVDTGTTVTVLPKDVAAKYWAQVKSAKVTVPPNAKTEQIWEFDCTEKLPDWPLKVGGKTVNVPGSVINMGPSSTAGRCTGSLQTNTDFKDWNIIGTLFIQGMYVVYDFGANGNARVGFAAKAAAANTATKATGSGASGTAEKVATHTPIVVS